jgi:BMFP domain-containing protein YqiC
MEARLQSIYQAITAALTQVGQALDDLESDPADEYEIDDVVALRTQAEELVTRLQKLEARLSEQT